MPELVAENPRRHLRTRGERINAFSLDTQYASGSGKPSLLRPDVVLVPSVLLARPGRQQEHVVHRPVPVIVDRSEVDLVLELVASLPHRILDPDILPVRIIRPVIRQSVRQRHPRPQHELETHILPVKLPVEIILRPLHQCLLLLPAGRELPVLKLHRQDNHPKNRQQQC